MIVLSHYQVKPLLIARERDERETRLSLDLGLSQTPVALGKDGVVLSDERLLSWQELEEIAQAESSCFILKEDGFSKIQFFSDRFNRVYTLWPTESAPTMLISGIPMHRIKGTDPHRDTLEKIKALKPISGRVLDTATGLGYTAIEAAKHAYQLITFELDPVVLEVCRCNPWSESMFNHPAIEQRIGDIYEEIYNFDEDYFSCILHDPPAFSLAGELYSAEFYRQLYRVLKPGGRLFHYIGNPKSRSGSGTTRGVVRRLRESNFRRVVPKPKAFGVLAIK